MKNVLKKGLLTLVSMFICVGLVFSMALSSLAIDAIAAAHTFAPMDPMLACLCGGALMGVGFGIVFSPGATTGGTDVVALIVRKYSAIAIGNALLLRDFLTQMNKY